MPVGISTVIKSIADLNNRYRDSSLATNEKIRMLWKMGDVLYSLKIKSPHSLGWAIQKATKGVIKRPTIFRSHKVRSIWPTEEEMLNKLGNIKALSNLKEMFPLIDPEQEVRGKLTDLELTEIFQHACADESNTFKVYITSLKEKYSHGRLGKRLDKFRHLDKLHGVTINFKKIHQIFAEAMGPVRSKGRDELRTQITLEELFSFSNMCIALTTKENVRLFKNLPPEKSKTKNMEFRTLYDNFRNLLNQKTDTNRARLRRVLYPEELAGISDMASSLKDEESVANYRERKKASIAL